MNHFETRLAEHRAQKDQFFRGEQSPLAPAKRQSFQGLSYFPVAPELIFQVPIESPPAREFPEFELQTSQGTTRFMTVLGQVTLPFKEGAQTLLLFTPLGEDPPPYVFIPFKDKTNGQETYTVGRYLEVAWATETQQNKEITLDFNMAYHPLCLFAERYACPLPPIENHLTLAIQAGECLTKL